MADQGDRRHLGWGQDDLSAGLGAMASMAFDIGTGPAFSSPIGDTSGGASDQIPHRASAVASPSQIVFIDGAVPDAQLLASGVKKGVKAVVLDPSQDGVAQIAAYLASQNLQNLAAIDIVAHGADGTLQLGSTDLDSATLPDYQSQLAQIGAALAPGGDLLLYSCDVGQDANGVAFLDQLSQATGGANVAASSTLVGSAAEGGSWDLNVNVGTIDVSTPFTAAAQSAYPDVLTAAGTNAIFASFNFEQGSTFTRITQLNVTNSTTLVGSIDIRDASQSTNLTQLWGMTVDAPRGKYFVVDQDGGSTVDAILEGNISGGAPVTLYSSPNITDYGITDVTIDEPNAELYFTMTTDVTSTVSGIYKISEAGGTITPVAINQGIEDPFYLAVDATNGLVFFTDPSAVEVGADNNNLDVAFLSNGSVEVLNSQLPSGIKSALSALDTTIMGVAVNAANKTLYFTAQNGATAADDFIMSATYAIVNGTSVAISNVTTLYNGTGANIPGEIVVDPQDGIFYVSINQNSNQSNTAGIYEGSLTHTGSGGLTEVYVLDSGSSQSPGLAFITQPTINASGTVTFAQGGTAVAVIPTGTVVDQDPQDLAGATVIITGGTFSGDGDTLTAPGTIGTNITASFSGETLTLSGVDTQAHYQSVLRSVAYKSTAANPTNSGANNTRTLAFTINDGVITSTAPTTTVNIHGLPTVTASGTATFNGGGSAVALDSGINVTDAYSTTLVSATVTIGNFQTGDTLTVGTAGGLTPSFSNGTLTLTGAATLATYKTALASVAYGFAAGGDPTNGGSHTSRTISWVVNDGTTASTAATSSLTLVHTAPTITASGTISYGGGSGPVALDPTVSVTTPDSASMLSSATVSVTAGSFAGDGDVFTAGTSEPSITTVINNSTDIITLTGSDTLADYLTVLRSLSINTSGTDPTDGGLHPTRTISWLVNDGVLNSAVSTSTAEGVICFCSGSMILTPTGEVAVEALQIGDLVMTERGDTRRIEWIGRGCVHVTRGHRSEATPVIIRKSAFADNVPNRDLHVTKGHAFHLDGALIPVEFLINHRTILWDDHAQVVEIHHIELETHDVLLANGAPAESYRDDGNRWMFDNANNGWQQPAKQPCAPILTGGPIVDAVWRRFLERSGWQSHLVLTDEPDLHLVVDGRPIYAMAQRDGVHAFPLPQRFNSVTIMSRDAVPAELGTARDFRSLGVALHRIAVRHGTQIHSMEADDPRLVEGFHAFEPQEGIRWTNGAAVIPPALFDGITGPIDLLLTVSHTAHYVEEGNLAVDSRPRGKLQSVPRPSKRTDMAAKSRRVATPTGDRRKPCVLASLAAHNRRPAPQQRATTTT